MLRTAWKYYRARSRSARRARVSCPSTRQNARSGLTRHRYRAQHRAMSTAHEKYTALQRHRNAGPLALDPRTTALVIIDMQEYFVNPASPFSRASEAIVPGVLSHFQERGRGVVEPSLRRLLDFFRARGLRVVYTTVASELPD